MPSKACSRTPKNRFNSSICASTAANSSFRSLTVLGFHGITKPINNDGKSVTKVSAHVLSTSPVHTGGLGWR